MKKFIFLTVLILCSTIYGRDISTIYIEKPTEKNTKEISPLFFGVNTLYWIDDDVSRSNQKYNDFLNDLNIKIMRYPGGEVADNFNWKTNTLYDRNSFPFSYNVNDPKLRTDFDEFVAWKNQFGAEAIIVVNLEQGFIDGDLERAAELAAEWVRYANIEKNYNIKYWEIGNESYHLGSRFALTAEEYAKGLKLFYQKMKAVDPTIHIGAVGPYDISFVPYVERLNKKEIERLRSIHSTKERKKYLKHCKGKVKKSINKNKSKSWWEIVAVNAKNYFDFAIIHRYTPERQTNKDMEKPLKLGRDVRLLSSFLFEQLGKEVPIALTEYNLAWQTKIDNVRFRLTLAEMLGNYLEAGVFISNYWPLRINGQFDKHSLFEMNHQQKPLYYIYQAFSKNIGKKLIKTLVDCKNLYTISTVDEKNNLTVFIINKVDRETSVNLKLFEGLKYTSTEMINKSTYKLENVNEMIKKSNKTTYRLKVSPLSLILVKFKNQGLKTLEKRKVSQ